MTSISATALDGLYKATQKFARAAQTVADGPVTGADYTGALVEAKTSLIDYQANAAVVKFENERTKHLLDILA
jgi:hypothetical protein